MKILVVEDEPLVRKGLVKSMKNIQVDGFETKCITEVEYAEDAVPFLEEMEFDIIFTDIEGGEMNGLELIDQWREKITSTQWVIVSGYDSFEYAQQAISYGVKEYLLKPVTKKKLAETVQRCVQGLHGERNDFIGAGEIEDILQILESSIWELDRSAVKIEFLRWQENMINRSLSNNYYCDILTHILEILFHRIKNKGSQLLQAFQWNLPSSSWENANTNFLQKCIELIEMIEHKRKGNEVDPIEMAKEFVYQHIEEEVGLDEVADKLGLNASYFSQLFKKETGETFVKYRIRLRMEKAKELLLRKDIKVIDIPYMIGLNDHPHFTKTFKRYTGHTPSSFRRKMGVD
ncbi:helix-turn-helix domain-containing protein [Alteribacillus sp. HJP-4]|uniref:response regulator transcription factor n=1 Tax=Alteribacillus sp. HJP-4 TaxID=2775394 RepID=UPI0035CCD013